MPRKKPAPEAANPPYQLTAQEQTAVEKFSSQKAANPAPRLKVTANGFTPDHDRGVGSVLLMEAFGTTDQDFANELLTLLSRLVTRRKGQIDEGELNFLLAVVKGVRPRDQVEAMLAAQMAAVHVQTMTFARRLAHIDDIDRLDSAQRAFNKLTRTFTAQTETLKRYRTGDEQRVTVHHVSVNDGGQAIVGNVTHAGRQAGPQRSAAASAETLEGEAPTTT